MQQSIRCGSIFAALALSMLAVQTQAQQVPRVQERQVQPAQPGQPLPGQPRIQPGQTQPGQPRVTQQARPGQQPTGRGTHVMAHWLLVDNQGEVELAKFVQEKSKNEEVKEFAKMMVQDHSDFINNLQQVAGALDGPAGQGQRPAQPGQPGQRPQLRQQPGQNQPDGQAAQIQERESQVGETRQQGEAQQDRDQPVQQAQQNRAQPGQPAQPGQLQPRNAQPGAPAQAGGRGFDIVAIKHELGQQCLASAKELLNEKEGAEFDKCYMGQQLFAHMQMLDTLKVFKGHASGEFAELIQGGIETTEDHLMHAENIMKKLDGGAAASTARRPGTQRD